MSKLIKAGLKTRDTGVAIAPLADENGNQQIVRVWEGGVTEILAVTGAEQTQYTTDAVDVSATGMVSLRAYTVCPGATVTLTLRGDVYSTSGRMKTMTNVSGFASIVLQGTGSWIITPDDMPALNYLRRIQLQVECPLGAQVDISVVTKR